MNSLSTQLSSQTILRRLVGSLLALVLIVSGCNLPSKSAESTQPEKPTPAAPLPSPTPAEPLQAVTMANALSSGVENGSWTIEQGLINGLRFMAGEISSEEAFGDVELISTEGTGVIHSAQRYLNEGMDEPTKAEMQRYLDMLMPSPEILEQISRPAPQSNAASHLARSLNRPKEQDRVLCQNLWSHSFAELRNPEGTRIPYDCLLRAERTVMGTIVRLYYPVDWGEDDPRLDSIELIMNAAQKSVEQYNGYGPNPIDPVYMVLTDLAGFVRGRFQPTVFAAADDFSDPFTCHIGVFPSGLAGSPENLQQTIAHEMFHCYQYTNLRAQTSLHEDINNWWVEGTAEFFGATVYPTNNDEFIFNDDFQAHAPRNHLFQMSYENYLFFQFLANQGGYGLEGVIEILRRMPTSGGVDEQQERLAAESGIGEAFHNFARAYMDRRLKDWSGSTLNIEPYVDGDDVRSLGEGDHQELFSPDSFKLGLYIVNYEDRMKFTNTTQEDGGTGKHAFRPREFVGAWQSIPPRINTNCDPTEYVMVVTSTLTVSAEPYELTESVNGEEQESEECECIHGTWELDNDSDYFYMYTLVGKIMEMMPAFGLDTSGTYAYLKSLSGQMRLNFTEDGQASGTQTDYSWTVEAIRLEDNKKVSMTSTFNGGGTANYTIQETPEGEKWIFFNNGTFDISNEITFMGRPVTTVPTGGSNTTIFLSSPVRYECSEDTLLYTTLPDIGTLIFHRLAPPSVTP